MEKASLASKRAPYQESAKSKNKSLAAMSSNQRSLFLTLALNMSWQLALAVLVPIVGGVELDKKLHMHNVLLFVGLALAVLLSTVVMWRAMQTANNLPTPKLTEAQKRAVKKAYEEEDKDE